MTALTFSQCLMECAANRELIAEFDRLTGSNLSMTGSPLDQMIDQSSGRRDQELWQFCEFVHDCIWRPLVDPAPHA